MLLGPCVYWCITPHEMFPVCRCNCFQEPIPKWDWTDFHFCWKPLCSLYAVSSEQPVCCSSKRGDYDKVLLDASSQVGCWKNVFDLHWPYPFSASCFNDREAWICTLNMRTLKLFILTFVFELFCSRILLDLMCFSLPLCLSLSSCIPITPAGFLVVCLPRWQIPLGFEPEITMATALLPLAHIDRSVVAQREMLLYQQSEHACISQIFHSNVLSPFSSHQTCRDMHIMPTTS